MYLIILLGFVLRLSFIIKPEGLWNDEYVSWMISATPFKDGFIQKIFEQCHMPLYYFYLKPFVNFPDVILRLTSVIPGVISIWIMYLAGKEYSKKVGIFSGITTSVLSFLVYYSQEVRFYSLLFFFASLSLLFTIKLLKNSSKKNIIFWILSLISILFTHVLGVIYVVLNSMYVIYKKKLFSKKVVILMFIIGLAILPFGINIVRMIPASQWWGNFSYTNIMFLFSDFFSPILTNNINAPSVFLYNKALTLWLVIPTLIGIIGFIFGVKKNKGFFVIFLLTVITMSILAHNHIIVFITKYSIEILPILILLTSIGFTWLKKIGTLFLSILIMFHIIAFFTPLYVTKIPRNEGHKLVSYILNERNPQTILFTYYEPDRFLRYTNLENKNILFISKTNRFEYKNSPEKILKDVKTDEKISVVFLDSVSFFDENQIDLFNEKAPEMFITFSVIRNKLQKELNDNYTNFSVDKLGSWVVITAKKR